MWLFNIEIWRFPSFLNSQRSFCSLRVKEFTDFCFLWLFWCYWILETSEKTFDLTHTLSVQLSQWCPSFKLIQLQSKKSKILANQNSKNSLGKSLILYDFSLNFEHFSIFGKFLWNFILILMNVLILFKFIFWTWQARE